MSSLSTIFSDDSSSRVYVSACESVTNSTEENESIDLPDILLSKNQPSIKLSVQQKRNNSVDSSILPREVVSHNQNHHNLQRQPTSIIAGQSTTSSATTTPLFNHQKKILVQPTSTRSEPVRVQQYHQSNPHYSSVESQSRVYNEELQRQIEKQRHQKEQEQQRQQHILRQQDERKRIKDKEQDQEKVLNDLKNQIEFMEQQRIKDREEWDRKEQELLSHRHKMMQALMETKDQINTVLKDREDSKIIYQKQLKQQQLHQLQQKVTEMAISIEQLPFQLQDKIPEVERLMNEANSTYDLFEADKSPRRRVNKSRSEEHLRYNSQSSSRSSHHYVYQDEANSYITYSNDGYSSRRNGEDSRKPSSISRRSSSASNKSGPSPQQYQRHFRTKSNETAKWYEDQRAREEYQRTYNKPKRSRSTGRDPRRPSSQNSHAYNEMEYNDGIYYIEPSTRATRYNSERHYNGQIGPVYASAYYFHPRQPSMNPQQHYSMYEQQPRPHYNYT